MITKYSLNIIDTYKRILIVQSENNDVDFITGNRIDIIVLLIRVIYGGNLTVPTNFTDVF